MDTFTRNYTIALVTVVTGTLLWLWLDRDERVDELNARLEADTVLEGYPYRFRVFTLKDGIATMGSPRSAQVSTMRFLRTAFPQLQRTAVDHPDMMAAQDVLANMQSRAEAMIRNEFDVRSVRWQIDERWFNERGVFLDLDP